MNSLAQNFSPAQLAELANDNERDVVVAVEAAAVARKTALMAAVNLLCDDLHGAAVTAGWHNDLHTGEPIKRNVGEMLMLAVTELAEAMEGHRKNLMDDKLPDRPMFEVELADCIIRIFDTARSQGCDLAGAYVAKRAFNDNRLDHKREARLAVNGKKC